MHRRILFSTYLEPGGCKECKGEKPKSFGGQKASYGSISKWFGRFRVRDLRVWGSGEERRDKTKKQRSTKHETGRSFLEMIGVLPPFGGALKGGLLVVPGS